MSKFSLDLVIYLRNRLSKRRYSNSAISNLRKEYSKTSLNEDDQSIKDGPFSLFSKWFEEACHSEVLEPNAMCLSTCKENKPSGRFVLLKGFNENEFVWYTNYESRKGTDINSNPYASLTFWWGELERSVRIEGSVEKVSSEESNLYFSSRPRGSQLGAWASNQSSKISSRESLDRQAKDIISKFEGVKIIPRPDHWGGFRLIPTKMEFWKGRESRLHDRIVYEREDLQTNDWKLYRLQP